MNTVKTTQDAVEMLRTHERTIERLYATYAKMLPGQADFWNRLSREEDQHARMIDVLLTRIERDPSSLLVGKFPTAAIEHSLEYINKLIERARTGNLDERKAISHALDLEQALLENKYFNAFESSNTEIQRILASLIVATEDHLRRVRNVWQETCQRQ